MQKRGEDGALKSRTGTEYVVSRRRLSESCDLQLDHCESTETEFSQSS